MTFVFFLILILVFAGILGFAFARTVTHIVKFAFFIIFVLLLIIVVYTYLVVHAPAVQTNPPASPPATTQPQINS